MSVIGVARFCVKSAPSTTMFFPMKRWRGAASGGNRPGAAGSTAVVTSNGTLM